MVLKVNAAEFRASLSRHNRKTVFHWTPVVRLASILEHGIVCRRELDGRGISYDLHGYGRAGKEQDFEGHVCVSFYPQKGMMKAEDGPLAVIEIDAEVVISEGAFHCPQNTAKSEYEFTEIIGWTGVNDLEDLFEGPNEWRLRDWQAEVWIPGEIPVDKFRAVWFRDAETRDRALESCSEVAPHLPTTLIFGVAPKWFPT